MSNDTRLQYEKSTTLNQDFLNHAHDNLVNKLEMVVDIERPDGGFIRASDRNKYVGSIFYEALLEFPSVKRTVGEFLSTNIEFSGQELELNNVDGRLNKYLPAGDNFDGWIGNSVEIKIGLGDIENTYRTLFKGFITEEGGFKRTAKSIIINARDKFDVVNVNFPTKIFSKAAFPHLDGSLENTITPIIYGDWTSNVEPNLASIPIIVVNGIHPTVINNTGKLECVISLNSLVAFDRAEVYLKRDSQAWKIPTADISNIVINSVNVSSFEVQLNSIDLIPVTSNTEVIKFEFSSSDLILVKVKGKDLGVYDDNIIAIAKDILITHTSLTTSDFDSNWDTLKNKTAINNIKSRAYIKDPLSTLEFVLSLLEQVRIEVFIDNNLKLKLLSLHFDDFNDSPNHKIKNWDIEEGSFNLQIDERNNFNRAKGVYNYLPNRDENLNETAPYKNNDAIMQAKKEITKNIIFPNLYIKSDVETQVIEILKITTSYLENVNVNLTWRSLLIDIGDFILVDVQIQSTVLNDVPCLIRDISYLADGIKIPVRLWSFQMIPFKNYNPNFSGITGGENATILI